MSAFKRYADFVAKLRMPCGFALVLAFALLARPSVASLSAGLPIGCLGLMLRAWAAGHLEKDRALAQSGPYAHVRNPLYLGTSLVAAGLVIATRRWALAALFAAVFVFIYLPAIELEEQHLRDLFPEFQSYARRVHKLWPSLKTRGCSRRFRWSLYRRNREYEALLGFLAGAAFLAVRCFWRS